LDEDRETGAIEVGWVVPERLVQLEIVFVPTVGIK
jgi:hypothetical protein